jgi:hypothetical protein
MHETANGILLVRRRQDANDVSVQLRTVRDQAAFQQGEDQFAHATDGIAHDRRMGLTAKLHPLLQDPTPLLRDQPPGQLEAWR